MSSGWSVAGRVILASRGMKAERMTILALVTDDEHLGAHYGVPIYPSREALLSDYPPQDYSELVDVDPNDVDEQLPILARVAISGHRGTMAEMRKKVDELVAGTGFPPSQVSVSYINCQFRPDEPESGR